MIRVQYEPLEIDELMTDLYRGNNRVGAVVSFLGLVRDLNQGAEVSSLTLEYYPGMTENVLQKIVQQAKSRWDLIDCTVVHRVGEMRLNDEIVFVGVSSLHREAAFSACAFIMDFLKTEAPFWKKETSGDESYWVDANAKDHTARTKWE